MSGRNTTDKRESEEEVEEEEKKKKARSWLSKTRQARGDGSGTRRIRGPRHGVATLVGLRLPRAMAPAAAVPGIVWRSGTPCRYLRIAEKRGGASDTGRIRPMRAADWPSDAETLVSGGEVGAGEGQEKGLAKGKGIGIRAEGGEGSRGT